MMSIDNLARNTADVAVRLLNGAPPKSITVPPQLPGSPTFDWRELQRWGITESRLPAGSVVRYRSPSLWQEYRFTVLGAAGALAIQSLLIIGLLYQRRARQRAELESRRNLALAADASRRETMSALTSSIAHELGQPLSSMMHDAEALRLMVTADRASTDSIEEILSDIQAQGVRATQIIDRHRTMLRSRQLQKKPIDLHAVLDESLALVAHDMSARQIDATVNLSSGPCVISGDPVLLQQVVVNLLMNAMDAMAETPPDRRQLAIRCDVRAADVEVSVSDTGTGLPEDVIGTLFTPFVTTKSHGLGIGLTIARTIVEAHGGTIKAHNNPERGRDIHRHAAPQRNAHHRLGAVRRGMRRNRCSASQRLRGVTWPAESSGICSGARSRTLMEVSVVHATPRAACGRLPRDGESRLAIAGTGLRGRGKRRGRQRIDGGSATTPA